VAAGKLSLIPEAKSCPGFSYYRVSLENIDVIDMVFVPFYESLPPPNVVVKWGSACNKLRGRECFV
jgi:hypothetical protein